LDWKSYYKERCVDAEDALKKIKPNSRLVLGHAIGEPLYLVDVMVKNKDWFTNLEILHMVAMGKGEYTHPGMETHFRHNSFFVGACTRQAVNEGRADFTCNFFYELPTLLRKKDFPVDVAMMQVSPPDKFGYVSVGVSVDYTIAAIEQADLVIAQVNENMPRTFGQSFVHVTDIDCFVEHSEPLVELKPGVITDVEKQIGAHCASLIEDGSTLQLGIGSLPDAVLLFLKDKNDLGIHSEMLSDGVVGLIEEGIVNNKAKTLHKGKSVVSFLMGTRKLYDFVDNNPAIEMYPIDYVNNPVVIMQNSKMVSINSCVQVDLMGQVASESVGLKQISAVGGQVDFVRGTNMAGGKSIIAMPSTAAGGKVSKIVPFLDHGAAVTTSRNDVNYIITEYGIAQLKGQTLRERARRLINVAHPDFRPVLIEEYEKRFRSKF
jgi:4-hydroxybutyrate CoA-transferase